MQLPLGGREITSGAHAAVRTCLGLCLVTTGTITLAIGAEQQGELGALLERLDRTAALYSVSALTFSCKETIRWEGRDGNGRRRFNYVVTRDITRRIRLEETLATAEVHLRQFMGRACSAPFSPAEGSGQTIFFPVSLRTM